MEAKTKQRALRLGGRIGFLFLTASIILILIAYLVLSQNFHNLLTDYSIQLVQSMADQGAATIENELRVSREETAVLASSLIVPTEEGQGLLFSTELSQQDILRIVYVSETGLIASSDGSRPDLDSREDIARAFGGETAVYGPYFDAEDQYVVCYSAPVVREHETVGVLSIEKDGYYFCELIKDVYLPTAVRLTSSTRRAPISL